MDDEVVVDEEGEDWRDDEKESVQGGGTGYSSGYEFQNPDEEENWSEYHGDEQAEEEVQTPETTMGEQSDASEKYEESEAR